MVDGSADDFVVVSLPQPSALRMLELDEVDVVMPLAKTAERSAYAEFAIPLLKSKYMLFTLPGAGLKPESESRYIAAIWYSAVAQLIIDAGEQLVPVDNYESAVEMIKRGRVDGVAIPEPVTLSMSSLLEGLAHEDYAYTEAGLYVARSEPELLASFNEAINQCLEDF